MGHQMQFNAQGIDPSMGLEALPDGWALFVMVSSEPKAAQSGNGGLLACMLEVADGPLKGKRQYLGLNLWNTNPQAVEIANREFAAIICVTLGANQGRLTINQSTDELHNIPFYGLIARDKTNSARSNIVAYRDVRGLDPKGQPPAVPMVMAGSGATMPTGQGQAPQPSFAPPGNAPQPTFAPPGQQAPQQTFQPPQQPQPTFAPPGQPQQQPPAFQPPTQQPPAPAFAPPGATAPQPTFQPPQQQPPQQMQQPPAQQGGWAPPGGGGAPAAQPSWQR